jgi:inner membrane transporter RhtA
LYRKVAVLAFNAVPPSALLLLSVVSLQVGAAWAKQLFHLAGPSGTAVLRLVFAAVILLAIWCRSLRMRRRTLAVVAVYGVVLAGMNLSIYHAMDRIPLGAAVTIEFLGPLAVAVFGSRRAIDLLWVALAALGVFLLSRMDGGLAVGGMCYALLAAAFWVGYILLSAKLGRQTRGGSALALGMVFASFVAVPFGVTESGAALIHPTVLVMGLVVALMSSVIPYSLELEALRRMPPRTFGILMSLHPAMATLAGLIVLGEMLTPVQWLAVGCVVVASIGATRDDGSHHDTSSGRHRTKTP